MIGKTILHYKILEKLGEGGMGEVYLAEDTRLKRKIALKFLPQHLTVDKDAKERFEREAQAAAALNHPNIVTIHEIGEFENPEERGRQTFIAMEYVAGKTLRLKIEECRLNNEEIVDFTTQICEGLSKAHQAGIVHRDIKPENILIDADGRVKILDFGLAKLKGAGKLTKETSTLGTVNYMSPEQAKGEEVDQRTDIWSLGVVLYEMLTGQLPFKGEYEQAVIYSILNEEPQEMENIPVALPKIIKNTLAKNPDERYQSTGELLEDLRAIHDHHKSFEKKEAISQKEKSKRKPIYIYTGIAIAIILISLMSIFFFPKQGQDSTIKSLAVLPFSNIKPDPNTDYLGFAFAAEIINDMSYFKNITIRPFSSVREIQSKEQLNVDYILTGNFIKLEDRISLNMEFFELETEKIIWQESLNRPFKESHVLLSDVSKKVINGLKIQFSNYERERMEKDIPQNPIAYEYFLKGISYPLSNKGHSFAIEMLKKSIEIDSSFSPAYTELGYRTIRLAQNDLNKFKDMGKVEEYYAKALKLNDENLIALIELSMLNQGKGKIYEAMDVVIKSLQLNPNSAMAHFSMSGILRCAGQLLESKKEAEIALQLDPKNPRFRSYGHTLTYLGEYRKAVLAYDIDKNSPWAKTFKGIAFFRQGKYAEATQYFNEVIKIESEGRVKLYCLSMLAYINEDYASGLKYIKKIADAGPQGSELIYQVASFLGLFNERQQCILYLKNAIEKDYLNYPFMLRDEFLNPVRNTPEFQELLALAKEKHKAFKQKYFAEE